jgi:hypothetical protein
LIVSPPPSGKWFMGRQREGPPERAFSVKHLALSAKT